MADIRHHAEWIEAIDFGSISERRERDERDSSSFPLNRMRHETDFGFKSLSLLSSHNFIQLKIEGERDRVSFVVEETESGLGSSLT
jgi:hypothetical protein